MLKILFRSVVLPQRISFRYASTKPSASSAILRHNWFDINSEFIPTDSSQLSNEPDRNFNEKLLKYLCQSARENLTKKSEEKLLENFQNWSPKEFYDVISILGGYGLQPIDVVRWLTAVPSADKTIVNVENLKKTFENLLHLQIDSTSRSILFSNDPQLIQYDLSYMRERFDVLLCYFTKREILKLIRRHKKLFSEFWKDLDYKINYLRIMLFASTRDIVECGALAHPIDHIRQRFLFVSRCGLFKRVRRQEQYFPQKQFNISLNLMFDSSLNRFLQETTNNLLRADDYQAFVDSLKFEEFDDEFEKYLTLDKTRKKWRSAEKHFERQERRHWMSEFDMFNDETKENDDDDKNELMLIQKPSIEVQTSFHHPLSDWNPDRHRQKKLAKNSDPNLRF